MAKIVVYPTMEDETGRKTPVTYESDPPLNYEIVDKELQIQVGTRASVVWAEGHFQRVELLVDDSA